MAETEALSLMFVLLFIIVLGYAWVIPKEDIYKSVVTVIVTAIGTGWILRKKRRRRD